MISQSEKTICQECLKKMYFTVSEKNSLKYLYLDTMMDIDVIDMIVFHTGINPFSDKYQL